MSPQEIIEKLREQFREAILDAKVEGVLNPFVKVSPASMLDVAIYVRSHPKLDFDFMMCLSGVDYGKGTLGVVYHLASMTHRHKITIKVEAPKDNAVVPSVDSIWQAANWHEREAFDLYGITFTGHPDLRRILLPEDWEGHPLRKDYKVPEFYQGMKVPY